MKNLFVLIAGFLFGIILPMQAQPRQVHHQSSKHILTFSDIEELIQDFDDLLDGYDDLANELKGVKKDLKKANSAMNMLKRQLAHTRAERDTMKAAYDDAKDFSEKIVRSEIYLKAEHERSKQDNEILRSMLDSKEQLTRHLKQMVDDYKKASQGFLAALEKMRQLAFKATFRLSAKQAGRVGLFRQLGIKRITDRLPLNEQNSYELKPQKINMVYIEALCAEDETILPDYYFTIEYWNDDNEGIYIFGNDKTPLPLPTANGLINYPIYHNWKKGNYKVKIIYEEDEMMKPQMTYYFKL